MATAIGAGAVFFALGGSARSFGPVGDAASVADDGAGCCLEIVGGTPIAVASAPAGEGSVPDDTMAASRWRVIDLRAPELLPVGVAPEQGLQVKTILVARSISALFPEIQSIGGVRPDSLRWHPNGLALDVMIPNPGSAEGIALGNEVVAFALKNGERFGLQDAIWRGTYYTPNGPQSSGYGHYDHVHITTTGGGYPTGGEIYMR